jgi:hypothetical protein
VRDSPILATRRLFDGMAGATSQWREMVAPELSQDIGSRAGWPLA